MNMFNSFCSSSQSVIDSSSDSLGTPNALDRKVSEVLPITSDFTVKGKSRNRLPTKTYTHPRSVTLCANTCACRLCSKSFSVPPGRSYTTCKTCALKDRKLSCNTCQTPVRKNVPAPRLVGIESNPGPPKGPVAKPNPKKHKAKKPKQPSGSNISNQFSRVSMSSGPIKLSAGSYSGRFDKYTTIEEDEYVNDINGSVLYTNQIIQDLNIGNINIFEWGSRLAPLYEKYWFEYVRFYYKREVSEFATNGSSGKVMMAFDYDSIDNAPVNKQEMESMQPHCDFMPCSDTGREYLDIDCKIMNQNGPKYVLSGGQPASTDNRLYSGGCLYVASVGQANNTAIGELHVKYKCHLITPVLSSALGFIAPLASMILVSPGGAQLNAGTGVAYDPFDNAGTGFTPSLLINNLGGSVGNTGQINLPAFGIYKVKGYVTTSPQAHDCTGINFTLQDQSGNNIINTLGGVQFTHTNILGFKAFSNSFEYIIPYNSANGYLGFHVGITATYAGGGTAFDHVFLEVVYLGLDTI